jgi:electron transport complex protein RnfC
MPCIRCTACVEACPADLQPHELYWFSRAKNFGKAQEYHLFDCIECGCCAYVCPSHIPLVDYYRFAKTEIWAREREKSAADSARERFDARNARLDREKREKAEKLAARASAPAAAAQKTLPQTGAEDAHSPALPQAVPPDESKQALINAAIQRAQAQRTLVEPKNTQNLTPEQLAEIREIEQRRAALRDQAKTPPQNGAGHV